MVQRSVFKSHFVRKLWFFFILMVTMLLVFFYSLLFYQQYTYKKNDLHFYSHHIYEDVNHFLETKHIYSNETLRDLIDLEGMSYKVILITHNGKILSSAQSTKLATPQPVILSEKFINSKISDLGNYQNNYTNYHNGTLETWQKLNNGYRMYAQISSNEQSVMNIAKPSGYHALVLLLPILLTCLIAGAMLYFIHRQYKAWNEFFNYVANIDQTSIHTPLQLPNHFEVSRYQHIFNRLSFRIHKQKKIITELKQQQIKALENLTDQVIITDKELRLEYANLAFLKNYKLSEDTLNNHLLTDFISAANSVNRQELTQITTNPKELKILVQSKQLKHKHDLFLSPIYDDNNEVMGFSGTLHDVGRYDSELEKLKLSQLELDDRLSANEKLWAVMGHELRTPLNGMLGMIQILADTELDDEQKDYLSTLQSSSDNMLFLLNDMLDLSKLDAGKVQSVIDEIDILTLCREVCDLMIGNARKKQVELIFHADIDLPRFVSTDSFRLRQILLNLLGNAFKFTAKGHVALLVEKVSADSDIFRERFIKPSHTQQWLCFHIQDTGPGIPEETQDQLFFFFNQANNTISRNFGGTGLGLAISKGLAEMLGGFIKLESEAGKGTSFKVYLPVTVDLFTGIYSYDDALPKQHIFIYEPNSLNIAHFNQLLTALEITFDINASITAESVSKIQKLETSDTNNKEIVILMDSSFIDSNKHAEKLFSHSKLKPIKKILTSFQPKRSFSQDISNKFEGFIEKPIMVEQFLGEILRVTANKSQSKLHNVVNDSNPVLNDVTMMQNINNASFESLPSDEHNNADSFDDIVDSQVLTSQSNKAVGNESNKTSESKVSDSKVSHSDTNESKNNSSDISHSEKTILNDTETETAEITVLLAEDNIVNQKVAKKMLSKNGFNVIIAENGQLAVDTFKSSEADIDLILMDCRMPKMDGLSATKEIRTFNDNIPIIALTANDSVEDREACHQAGMNDFLAKPINQSKLIELVNKHIKKTETSETS